MTYVLNQVTGCQLVTSPQADSLKTLLCRITNFRVLAPSVKIRFGVVFLNEFHRRELNGDNNVFNFFYQDARRATELEAVMEKQKMKVDLKLESSTL